MRPNPNQQDVRLLPKLLRTRYPSSIASAATTGGAGTAEAKAEKDIYDSDTEGEDDAGMDDLMVTLAEKRKERVRVRAVQFHPHGGQFDFIWLSARTPCGAYVR